MCKNSKFSKYVAAGYPLLWIETYEEYRAMTTFAAEMGVIEENYDIYSWDRIDGIRKRELVETKDEKGNVSKEFCSATLEVDGLNDFNLALQWAGNSKTGMKSNSILFLLDYHHYIKKDQISRKIRNLVPLFKSQGKMLVIISHKVDIPPEIEKEITVVPFGLPDLNELKRCLKSVCEDAEAPYPKNDKYLLDAALGMTSFEAENAYALSLIEKKKFDPEIVRREKATIVKKTGLLEVIEVKESIADIGGLNNLKLWLQAREGCFSKEATDFGIKAPKGLLLGGVPGTGKSLTAKVVASIFQRPLLRLDMGKVFGSYVGDSESNIRKCLKIAEAVAPVCLWIDELEKSFSNMKNGGGSHETSMRVFSTFLTWLQEKTADVFIVATANDVQSLPPALIRSGRIDTTFWVDVPDTIEQRVEILNIHLKKVGHENDKLNHEKLAETCDGFTGAEIEVWVKEALVRAFQQQHDLSDQDFLDVHKDITPIAVLMKEDIDSARAWAQARGVKWATVKEEELEKTPTFQKTKRKINMN